MMAIVGRQTAKDMNHDAALDLSGRTLVVGLGVTGASVVRFLRSRGCDVCAMDSRENPPGLTGLRDKFPEVDINVGSLDASAVIGINRVILSPGLPVDLPLVTEARRRGLPVINDIEIFAAFAKAPIVAITGSNGKSTVTSLVSVMLEACGYSAPAGGNLGTPALDLLAEDADVFVLEISSFQMETVQSLRPTSAAVLNVTPDHLDRHGNFEHYAGLKEKLLTGAKHAVVNADDPYVKGMGERHGNPTFFSTHTELDNGYSLIEFRRRAHLAVDRKPLIAVADLAMRGSHNVANALAALAIVEPLVVDLAPAVAVLKHFKGLANRCEYVASIEGATYINDSKATNVAATVAALQGFDGAIILIAGGQSKGADFEQLRQHIPGKVKAIIVIGEAAEQLTEQLGDLCPVKRCRSMREAVQQAGSMTAVGDTVLLSPACSSLDMFANYEARGAAFKEAAAELNQ